jgi:acetyl-CoA C-acetyltransferase
VQLAELNEAFACVAALATRELGLDADIVNVNGGAVALGHPLGNTGTCKKRGQEIGLTGAGVGGGQGAGSVIKIEG